MVLLPLAPTKSTPPKPQRQPVPPFQPPLRLYGDDVSVELEWLIRKMAYDDAPVRRGWRLEYLALAHGFKHYRLYKGGIVIGVQDIRSPSVLPRIQRHLAAYLAGIGFTPDNTRLVVFGARTSLSAPKHGIPRLF